MCLIPKAQLSVRDPQAQLLRLGFSLFLFFPASFFRTHPLSLTAHPICTSPSLQASQRPSAAVSSGGIRCSQQPPCRYLWSPAWRLWIYDSVFGNCSETLMRKARSERTELLLPCIRLLSSSWCHDNIH